MAILAEAALGQTPELLLTGPSANPEPIRCKGFGTLGCRRILAEPGTRTRFPRQRIRVECPLRKQPWRLRGRLQAALHPNMWKILSICLRHC
ncbi:hypothetical protein D3C72_1369560 [compost metagenome]